MMRLAKQILLLTLLLGAWESRAEIRREIRLPLDPDLLHGASIFTSAEDWCRSAANAAGLSFQVDPRPLPPQVLLLLDAPDGRIRQRGDFLIWRGDMLPDQLAPGESGILLRKRRSSHGRWSTTRSREHYLPGSSTNLVASPLTYEDLTLPPMIIETAYQIGFLEGVPLRLVIWRSAVEDSPPLGGYLALPEFPPQFPEEIRRHLPPCKNEEIWSSLIEAFAP